MKYDFAVIGGGIVGLSTAWQLIQKYPGSKICLLEKEADVALHQTGRNSGVIHAGVYYQPGSLKAQFCKQGLVDTIAFCKQYNIAYDQCGKLIVATNQLELERMNALYQRCLENGIEVSLLNEQELHKVEPNVTGLGAIYSPTSAITDYPGICRKLRELFEQAGGEIIFEQKVVAISETPEAIRICCENAEYKSKFLVCCAGLFADTLTEMMGLEKDFRIIPFKGEYYRIPQEKNSLVKHMIYPVPDPDLPFLGIHLTPMIGGYLTVGPNAIQAWKKEGYSKLSFSLREFIRITSYSGYWKLISKHLKSVVEELKASVSKNLYLQKVRKYCPDVSLDDLGYHPSGIRAQAVLSDGTMVQDFLFKKTKRSFHVCNAPSPAATSAFPIGNYLVDEISKQSKELL